MFYLCIAFTVSWLANFAYIFAIDSRIKDLTKRLDARQTADSTNCN
jgi:CcmD family protein